MVHRKVSLLVCLLAVGCSTAVDTSTSGPAPTTEESGVAVNQVSFSVPDMT